MAINWNKYPSFTSLNTSDKIIVSSPDGNTKKVPASAITSSVDTLHEITTIGNVTTNSINIGSLTAPTKKLTVTTSTASDGILGISTDGSEWFKILNTNSTTFPVGQLYLYYGSNVTSNITALSNEMRLSGGYTTGGKIVFRSATTEKMRLDSTGLGIGTTSPSSALDVVGNADVGVIQVSHTTNGCYGSILFGTISRLTGDCGTWNFKNTNTNTTQLYINDTGVGIGTTSPSEKLNVNGNIRVEDEGEIYIQGGTSTRKIVRLDNTSDKGLITLSRADDIKVSISSDVVTHGHTYFNGLNANVLIGTATNISGTKLNVVGGDIRTDANVVIPADGFLKTSNNNLNFIELYNGSDASMRFKMGHSTVGRFQFLNSSDTEVFTIDARNERVGIGTSSPARTLDINGDLGLATSVNAIRINGVGVFGVLNGMTRIVGQGSGVNNGIVFTPNADNTEKMRLTSDGKLGVSITNPTGIIHGYSTSGIVSESPGNATIIIKRDDNTAYSSLLKYHSGNSEKWVAGLSDTGDFTGSTGNDYFIGQTKNTPVFLINTSNNIGIGTASPGGKLDVSGVDNGVFFRRNTGQYFKFTTDAHSNRIESAGKAVFFGTTDAQTLYLKTNDTARITIDSAGAATFANNVIVSGDLTVSGTTVTVDTTNLNVQDKNITLNYSTGDSSSTADGAGITIQDAVDSSNDATILWDATNDEFDFSHSINVSGNAKANTYYVGNTSNYLDVATGLRLRSDSNGIRLMPNGTDAGYIKHTGIDLVQPLTVGVDNTGHDVKFYGATSGRYMLWDESQDTLILADNVYLRIGSNNDMYFFHDGTDTKMRNLTGDLYIENHADGKDVIFQSDDGSGGLATYFFLDGGQNSSSPYTVWPDQSHIALGSSYDLDIYHTSTQSIIENWTGNFTIRNNANDADLIFQSDDGTGSVATYFSLDGSIAGGDGAGTLFTMWPDNSRIGLGNNADLRMYHDGSNSQVINLGGSLIFDQRVDDNDIIFKSDDGSGGTTTYFYLDGSIKHTRFAQPVLFDDNVNLDFGGNGNSRIKTNGTDTYIQQFVGNLNIANYANDKDISFQSDDGSGGVTTYLQLDGSSAKVLVNRPSIFYDTIEMASYIYHNGNTSTYFGFSGADTYTLVTGNTTAFTVNSNQAATFAGDVQAAGLYVGATNTSFDFYNNGTSYLNGATTIDDNTQINGNLTVGVNDTGHDVIFYGATSGKHMHWDESSNGGRLNLNGGADLYINQGHMHISQGSYYFKNASDGTQRHGFVVDGEYAFENVDLRIQATQKLYLDGGSDTYITENAANNLQFVVGGNQKLVLGNSGSIHNQHFKLTDNYQLQLGTGADIQFLHTGTHMYMYNATGNMTFKNNADNGDIIFQSDNGAGGTATYFKLDGATSTHDGTATTALYTNWPDKSIISVGNSHDLQIYHDGSNSYVKDAGTGGLILMSSQTTFQTSGANRVFVKDSGVELVTPLTVGVDDTGHDVKFFGATSGRYMLWDESLDSLLISSGARLRLGGSNDFWIFHDGTDSQIINRASGDLIISGHVTNGDIKLINQAGGGANNYIVLDSGEEKSIFYQDTRHRDNVKAYFGASDDLQIYHDGSNSYIVDAGAGDLLNYFSNEWKVIKYGSSEICIEATSDGAVDLYYDGSKKFETYAAGVGVTGSAYLTSGNHIHFDNGVTNDYYVRKSSSTLEFKTGGTYNFLSGNATFAGDVTATDGSDTAILKFSGLVLSRSNSYIQSNADNSDTLNIGQSSVRWGHVKVDGADFAVLNGGNERFKVNSSGNSSFYGNLSNVGASNTLSLSDGSNIRGSNHLFLQGDASYVQIKSPNNYIYYDAVAHNFRNANASSAYLVLNSTSATFAGNILIGSTATTDAKLNIVADGETTNFVKLKSTKGTGVTYGLKTNGVNSDVLAIMDITAGNRIAALGNNEVSFNIAGVQKLGINSSGNATFAGTIGSGAITSTGTIEAPTLYGNHADGNGLSLKLGRADNSNYWEFNHAGNDLRIYNTASSGSHILFGVNGGGNAQANNVGIGTAAPDQKLHVVGNLNLDGDANISGDLAGLDSIASTAAFINTGSSLFSAVATFNGDTYTTGGYKLGTSGTYVGKMYNSSGKLTIESDGDRDIQLQSSNNANIIYIDTSRQDVGINTSSPDHKLHLYDAECNMKFESSHGRYSTFNQGGGHFHLNTNHVNGLALNYGNTSHEGLLAVYNNTTAAIKIDSIGGPYGRIHGTSSIFLGGSSTSNVQLSAALIPDGDSTRSLGNANRYWSHGYIDAITTTGNITLGSGSTENRLRTYFSDNSYTDIHGYGLFMSRVASYIRPTADGTQTLFVGASGNTWNYFSVDANNIRFQKDGTDTLTVDGSGNATFAGIISTPDGSATTPAYNFSSHDGNGMYLEEYDPSANKEQVSIATDGARRFKANEAGIWSELNVYFAGSLRKFGEWHATSGTSGQGFRFTNTADSVDALSITSAGNATFAGEVEAASLDINGNADISGNLTMSGNANLVMGTGQLKFADGGDIYLGDSNDLQIYHAADQNYIRAANTLNIATENSGVQVNIGHTTSEVIIKDNLVVNGNLTTKGDTILESTTNTTIKDTVIQLNDGVASNSANSSDSGIMINRGSLDKVFMGWDEAADKFVLVTTSSDADAAAGTLSGLTTESNYQTLVANIIAPTMKIGFGNSIGDVHASSTNTSLGTSNTLVPTQNAVKTYADTKASLTGDQTIAGNKTFSGVTELDGCVVYSMSASQLTTTGVACAGLSSASNGASALFTFECGGSSGNSYQRIVYNCYNDMGTWNTNKCVDEGGNKFDVVASANGSTITFTWKSRSGTQYYTPRIMVKANGQSIVKTYT